MNHFHFVRISHYLKKITPFLFFVTFFNYLYSELGKVTKKKLNKKSNDNDSKYFKKKINFKTTNFLLLILFIHTHTHTYIHTLR